MQERYTDASGNKVFYYSAGAGAPLMFVHGFCEDHRLWEEFITPFVKDYHVLLIDLPGFGKSVLSKDGIEIGDYADCVKAVLDAEQITKCAMIGHSLGGYVTLNFASRFPELLNGFALFHSFSYEDNEEKKLDRIKVAEFVRSKEYHTLYDDALHHVKKFVRDLNDGLFGESFTRNHNQKLTAVKEYFSTISSVEGIANASLAMGRRKDTTGVVKNTKVPVLFIIGKEDKVATPEKMLQIASLPHTSVICLLDFVAHMGMFEAKEKTQECIKEWLGLCSF